MSVKVTGRRDFKRSMKKLGSGFDSAVDDGVFLTAQEVRNYAVKSIREQSSGKSVRRSRQGGGTYAHIAAAAGEAPNTDTGKLIASIAAEKIGESNYEIGSGLPYAAHLEFGTKDGVTLLARPWLEPALRINGENMTSNISEAVRIQIDRLTT